MGTHDRPAPPDARPAGGEAAHDGEPAVVQSAHPGAPHPAHVPPDGVDDRPGDGRSETIEQRSDRNWNELLQELRVMQTGVQVLSGFLLTLPFQAAFADLDHYQRTLYLVLVVLAVGTTGVLIAPVSVHRALFQKGLKAPLVRTSNRLARTALVMLGLVVTGTAMLAFHVVLSRTAGVIVGVLAATGLALLWFVLPHRLTGRRGRERRAADAA